MKVLIISHNPITTYQSMGKTFLSLFCEFSRDELCQLYIYPSLPDVDVCHSYYRETDRNIFDSYFHFGKVNGREISCEQIDTSKHNFYENEKEEEFINIKKTPIKSLLRDLMWKFSKWYNTDLKKWIEKERPTCIFLAPGEAKFIYDVAMTISRQYTLPIVTYICDEFYFVGRPENYFARIQLYELKKKIEKLMSFTKLLITISDELNGIYSTHFNKTAITVYTGAKDSTLIEMPRLSDEIKGLFYFGNLAYGRFESLSEIAQALESVNKAFNKEYRLYIYTRILSEAQKAIVDKSDVMIYCGYVTGSDFDRAYTEADVLVHIESFRKEYMNRVKSSISTKIADALNSGKPLFAYGPDSIASMKYLAKENAACVVFNKEMLQERLKSIIDVKTREELVRNALNTAKKNHCSVDNSRKLRQEVQRISDYER